MVICVHLIYVYAHTTVSCHLRIDLNIVNDKENWLPVFKNSTTGVLFALGPNRNTVRSLREGSVAPS